MRSPTFSGVVVAGRRLGRELGFPTVNVAVPRDQQLDFGVYAGHVDGWPAAISVGVRPTIGDDLEPLAEAHLLDFDGDLYGAEIVLSLEHFLRPEQRFADVASLTTQIENDVRRVRDVLSAGERGAAGRDVAPGSTAPAPAAIDDLGRGRMVLISEDPRPGAESVLAIAANDASADVVNVLAREARGLIAVAMAPDACERLGLDVMSAGDARRSGRSLTISIEAREGTTTGISAADRARTIAVAVDPASTKDDLVSPGHVFPLRVAAGGVLAHPGAAEAALDAVRLARRGDAAVIATVLDEDGAVAGGGYLDDLCERLGIRRLTVSDVADRCRAVPRLELVSDDARPESRAFRTREFRSSTSGRWHVAVTTGDVTGPGTVPVMVCPRSAESRVHGSGGPGPLQGALRRLAEQERGAVLSVDAPGAGPDERAGIVTALLRQLSVDDPRVRYVALP